MKHLVYIALPVLGEYNNLDAFFKTLQKQTYQDFKIYICVNQYDDWWADAQKLPYCHDNRRSLNYLNSLNREQVVVIDRSSKGKGWPVKKGGVGWARKTLMDRIASEHKEGIIVSMDADTHYPENYLKELIIYFKNNQDKTGLSVPYYHRLDNRETDRLILRYEIYMRYYAHNMLRIGNPYNFTALGSAMAIPLRAYRKIGGMTPVKSGEDFYLLQKLVKTGKLGQWVDTLAFPSGRLSDRVLFGTGPALIKGKQGDWNSYPLYPAYFFDFVKQTYDTFPGLYEKEIETPMSSFLENVFRTNDLWGPLRKNFKDRTNFVNACATKVDGLRILQFLKSMYKGVENQNDEQVVTDYLMKQDDYHLDDSMRAILHHLHFDHSPVQELALLRNFLFEQEMKLRKKMEIS